MDDGCGSFDHQSIEQYLKNREFGKACLELAYECLVQAHLRLQLANRACRKASDDRFITKLGHYGGIAMQDISCAEQLLAELSRQSEFGAWEGKQEDIDLLSQYAKDLKKVATSVAIGSWSNLKLPPRLRRVNEYL